MKKLYIGVVVEDAAIGSTIKPMELSASGKCLLFV